MHLRGFLAVLSLFDVIISQQVTFAGHGQRDHPGVPLPHVPQSCLEELKDGVKLVCEVSVGYLTTGEHPVTEFPVVPWHSPASLSSGGFAADPV